MPTMLANNSGETLSPKTLASLITTNSGENLQTVLDSLEKRLLLSAHPIGSVYITTTKTSPQTIMGGTWRLICTDSRGLMTSGDATPTYGGARRTITFSDGSRGTYEVIYNHRASAGVFTTSAFEDQGTPTSGKFSRVKHIGDFYNNNNEIEFLMYSGSTMTTSNTGRWIQKSSFLDDSNLDKWNRTPVMGYRDENGTATTYLNGLYVPWKGKNLWGGLGKSRTYQCDALGCPSRAESMWWYPIGQRELYNGGIPFGDSVVNEMTLLVRVDNVGTNFTLGMNYGSNAVALELSQLPCHSHMIGRAASSGGSSVMDIGGGSNNVAAERTLSTGSNVAHNNMQPYITAFIWERTA